MRIRAHIESLDQKGARRALAIGLIVAGMVFFAATGTAASAPAQLAVGGVGVALLLGLGRRKANGATRVAFLGIAALLSLDYVLWRTFTTLTYHDLASFSCALLLYLAEMHGVVVHGLGLFVNLHPRDRQPCPLPENEAEWPTVDVLIATCDEEKEILEVALLAALAIDYPRDKLRVFLCDDGGTDERCHAREPAEAGRAAAARERRRRLQALCAEAGATYRTRPRNLHGKAGSLNHAIAQSAGDLLLVLDADHVPTADFLRHTVGWFLADPKMLLVQTPLGSTNPDPTANPAAAAMAKSAEPWHRWRREEERRERLEQRGLDGWNAVAFAGSAAVLRRAFLREIGGFVGETTAADAAIALARHAPGHHRAYLDRPMVARLSPETPETLGGFLPRRARSTPALVASFRGRNPRLARGLTIPQRLCDFRRSLLGFFPFARLTFLLAPVAFLVFPLPTLYAADFLDFLAFAGPHLVATFLGSAYLFGAARWPFFAELLPAVDGCRAIGKAFRHPRAPSGNVPAKGEPPRRNLLRPLARPLSLLLAVNLLALLAGVSRGLFGLGEPSEPGQELALGLTILWAGGNLFALLAGLGARREQRQRRAFARRDTQLRGRLILGERKVPVDIMDLSNGGAALAIDATYARQLQPDRIVQLEPERDRGPEPGPFHLEIRNLRYRDRTLVVGCRFRHANLEEMKRKIAFVHGGRRGGNGGA